MRGEERFHAASPKGTVLEQNPSAGSRDVEGASVTLAVSAGQQSAKVPAVSGMARADAERALEEAGFDVAEVAERPSNTPAGQVIDSRPAGGSDATIPSAVTLIVSAGPSVVLVPSIIGRPVSQARIALEGAGLSLGEVRTPDGELLNDDNAIVTASTPAAGAQVAAGSKVSLQATPRR
jgi:serine/threonine-protein kinase